MNADQLRSLLADCDKADLVRRLEADLDRFSPLIGADGPPDQPGPEEPYIRVLQQSADTPVAAALTGAIQVLLLDDAAHLAKSCQVRRPLLLFNLFSVLEAVRLPGLIDSLRVLRTFEQPLATALVDSHDDLYAQLLIAHAVNQHGSPEDLRFWLDLLDHECIDYVSAGNGGTARIRPFQCAAVLDEDQGSAPATSRTRFVRRGDHVVAGHLSRCELRSAEQGMAWLARILDGGSRHVKFEPPIVFPWLAP